MIKLENVNFKYRNGKEILKKFNLDIKEGECISIIGKNGSRKIYTRKTYCRFRKAK